LTKAGHEVIPAIEGESGLQLAFRHNPALVVLDVMLPQLHGPDVAKRLRQTPLTRHVAILMLTARAQIADKVSGFESGADDYLTSPSIRRNWSCVSGRSSLERRRL
jgi:two-component system, OmpR family, phosphate regulon response regulator PhoB